MAVGKVISCKELLQELLHLAAFNLAPLQKEGLVTVFRENVHCDAILKDGCWGIFFSSKNPFL